MKKLIDISNKDYTTNPNTGINLNDYEVVNVVNYEENINYILKEERVLH